jgi:hypothetical protein
MHCFSLMFALLHLLPWLRALALVWCIAVHVLLPAAAAAAAADVVFVAGALGQAAGDTRQPTRQADRGRARGELHKRIDVRCVGAGSFQSHFGSI